MNSGLDFECKRISLLLLIMMMMRFKSMILWKLCMYSHQANEIFLANFRALQHSHDTTGGAGENNNPVNHASVAQPFGAQPGLDYSMQRSPRDTLYPSHMVSSHIQSKDFVHWREACVFTLDVIICCG